MSKNEDDTQQGRWREWREFPLCELNKILFKNTMSYIDFGWTLPIVYHNELTINFLKPPVAALNKITEFTIIIIILGKSHNIDSLIFLELFILFSKEGFIYLYSTEYCLLSSAH